MAKKATATRFLLVANHILTGRMVFWSQAGNWDENLSQAASVETAEAWDDQAKQAEADNQVVSAYAMGLDDQSHPVELRDQLRLQGVTVAFLRSAQPLARAA